MWVALAMLAGCGDRGPSVDALAAALPADVQVERLPGEGPPLVVLEVPDGDPRVADAAPDAALVASLRAAGVRDVVTDVPSATFDGLDVVVHAVAPSPDPNLPGLRRLAGTIEQRETQLAALRDLVLAGAAPPEPARAWAGLREESLRRFAETEAAAAARGVRLVDASPPAATLVLVPGVASAAAAERGRQLGRAVVVVRPKPMADLFDPPVWWARVRAGFPPSLPPEGRLPSFAPWVEALGPHVAALRTWDEAEAVRADIRSQVGPPPPELGPDDPRRAAVLAGARRLREVLVPGLDATAVLGDPVVTVAGLTLCERPMRDTVMSYDPLFDVLKVEDWVAELPVDQVAVVLAHELVHVRDVRVSAGALGTDPAGWAFAHDTLPLGVGRGVAMLQEDRAYRVELELVAAMGLPLPTPEEAERGLRDDAPDVERVPAILRSLGEPGSLQWMQVLSDMVRGRG